MGDTLFLNADCQPIGLIPISAHSWKKAIQQIWMGEASVLHAYDDWEVRSPSMTMQVPAVILMNRYTSSTSKKLVRFNRKNVFMRDEYRCQYCEKEFSYSDLTYDHVVPQTYGGKTNWTNIVAACRPCNGRRGCNQKIRPVRMPYKPTYWEMADKIKRHPIVVPHESWVYYLDWNPDLVTVRSN